MKKGLKRKESGVPGLPYNSEIIAFGQAEGLSPYEVFLLLVLRSSMNPTNLTCWKSERTLSNEMRCSQSTVKRSVKSLRRKGILNIKSGHETKGVVSPTNEYGIATDRVHMGHKEPSTEVTETQVHGSHRALNTAKEIKQGEYNNIIPMMMQGFLKTLKKVKAEKTIPLPEKRSGREARLLPRILSVSFRRPALPLLRMRRNSNASTGATSHPLSTSPRGTLTP